MLAAQKAMPPRLAWGFGLGWLQAWLGWLGWLASGLIWFDLAWLWFGFGLIWLDLASGFNFTRILIGFDLIWFDFGWIWFDLGWIWLGFCTFACFY